MTKQIFYWSVDFKDGYNLSQFDGSGKEILIKDIVGKECWTDKGLEMKSNFFGKLEQVHGNVTKVSWKPFSQELYKKIESVDPSVEIILFNKAVNEISQIIPESHYAIIKKTIDIKYGLNSNGKMNGEADAIMSGVTIGHLPRKKSIWNYFNPGKITEYDITIQ